jgi:hypothetical protein
MAILGRVASFALIGRKIRCRPRDGVGVVMLIGAASVRKSRQTRGNCCLFRCLEAAYSSGRVATPTDHNHGAGLVSLRALDRHQFDREAVLVPLTGLQRPDTDHLTRDLLALLVGDRNDNAVLALLAAPGMMNGPLDAHGRNRLSLRLRIDGVEAQVMLAPRADVRALQDRCLAVRTYPCAAESALASDGHC